MHKDLHKPSLKERKLQMCRDQLQDPKQVHTVDGTIESVKSYVKAVNTQVKKHDAQKQ